MSDHIPDTGKMVTEEAITIAAAIVAEEATRCLWENISEQGRAQWLSRMRAYLPTIDRAPDVILRLLEGERNRNAA